MLRLRVQFILSADMGYQFFDGNPPTNAPPAFVQVNDARPIPYLLCRQCQRVVIRALASQHASVMLHTAMYEADGMIYERVCLHACGSPCILHCHGSSGVCMSW